MFTLNYHKILKAVRQLSVGHPVQFSTTIIKFNFPVSTVIVAWAPKSLCYLFD